MMASREHRNDLFQVVDSGYPLEVMDLPVREHFWHRNLAHFSEVLHRCYLTYKHGISHWFETAHFSIRGVG
jgi:hypothetical protein